MYLKALIQFQEQNNRGKFETKKETYLIDAVSWTEGEARVYKAIGNIHSDFTIKRLDPFRVADIFIDESIDDFYLCKVVYVTENDKGKEKRVNVKMLISAKDSEDAAARLKHELRTMLVPFEISDVTKSPILEVLLKKKKDAQA